MGRSPTVAATPVSPALGFAVRVGFLVLLLGVAGCSEPRRARVLLIGIDGASPRVSDALRETGELPHLERIAEQGASGRIESAEPLLSPRVWNTISTGRTPERHGITNFTRTDEAGEKHLLLSTDRRVHALWNIASDAGLKVAVVNWWNTFPPEKVNGVMVSDHLVDKEVESRMRITGAGAAESGAAVYPVAWEARARELIDQQTAPVAFPNPFAAATLPSWADPAILTKWFEQDAALMRIALELEANEEPDVMMVLLPGIDRVSHSLWGTLEPEDLYPKRLRPDPEARAGGAEALRSYYRYTDALVGALVTRFHRDDLVVVVSDHGFEAGTVFERLTGAHDGGLARWGVLFARGRGIAPGSSTEGTGILDVTPTVLAWLGLPIAEDMPGAPAAFLGPRPLAKIASYETKAIERLDVGPSGADAQMLEKLRSLGYLE